MPTCVGAYLRGRGKLLMYRLGVLLVCDRGDVSECKPFASLLPRIALVPVVEVAIVCVAVVLTIVVENLAAFGRRHALKEAWRTRQSRSRGQETLFIEALCDGRAKDLAACLARYSPHKCFNWRVILVHMPVPNRCSRGDSSILATRASLSSIFRRRHSVRVRRNPQGVAYRMSRECSLLWCCFVCLPVVDCTVHTIP